MAGLACLAADKLGDILDDSQASKFADKLFSAFDEFRSTATRDKSKKRKVGFISYLHLCFNIVLKVTDVDGKLLQGILE